MAATTYRHPIWRQQLIDIQYGGSNLSTSNMAATTYRHRCNNLQSKRFIYFCALLEADKKRFKHVYCYTFTFGWDISRSEILFLMFSTNSNAHKTLDFIVPYLKILHLIPAIPLSIKPRFCYPQQFSRCKFTVCFIIDTFKTCLTNR